MKASHRPSVNPAVAAMAVLVAALAAAVGLLWKPSEGAPRFFLLVGSLGIAYLGVVFLDKLRVRTQFPLGAEGARLFRAWQQLMDRDWGGSLANYTHVLEKNPKNTEALLHAALLEIQFDRMADADAHLQSVIALCDDDPEVHYARALWLHNQGRYAEAAEAYARRMEPGDYRGQVAHAFAVYQAGDRGRAFEHVQKAAGQYTQTRFRRTVDVELPAWALAQGLYFLAPDLETAGRQVLRVFQWTESFWHGKSWHGEFAEIKDGETFRARHLLSLKVLLGKAQPAELTDLFEARDLEPQFILSGHFALAVKQARDGDAAQARAGWESFLEAARRRSTPPLVPSLHSFEGCMARFELGRLDNRS